MGLEILGHGSYVFALCAYLVRDILWLRALAIGSCLTFMVYVFLRPGAPDWILIGWNGVFVLVNLVQIVILFLENRAVSFSTEERELRDTIFRNFSDIEFMKLFKYAEWTDIKAGTKIVEEGEPVSDLLFLTKGTCRVEVGGVTKAKTYPFMFVGEISFLSGDEASATVIIEQQSRCVKWSQESLRKLVRSYPSIDLALKSVVGQDLSVKVKAHGEKARSTTVFEPQEFEMD